MIWPRNTLLPPEVDRAFIKFLGKHNAMEMFTHVHAHYSCPPLLSKNRVHVQLIYDCGKRKMFLINPINKPRPVESKNETNFKNGSLELWSGCPWRKWTVRIWELSNTKTWSPVRIPLPLFASNRIRWRPRHCLYTTCEIQTKFTAGEY